MIPVQIKFRSETKLMMILIQKYNPKLPDNDTSYSPSNNNLPLLVSNRQQQQKIEEKETRNVEEEMLFPRTLKIKFGEEYSSSVYYITIHVLLFYDDAKKKKRKRLEKKCYYLVHSK